MTAPILMSTAGWSNLTNLLVLLCAIGGVLFGVGMVLEKQSQQTKRLVGASVVAVLIVVALAAESDAAIAVYWPWEWWPYCFCLVWLGF